MIPSPIIQKLTLAEQQKIDSDLHFIKNFLKFSNHNNFRTILSGGYALDSCPHTITRPHNDIDLIIYSCRSRHISEQLIKEFISSNYPDSAISSHSGSFNTSLSINYPGLGVDIYIVETVNHPQKDIHTVKKLDGKMVVNSTADFPLPIKTHLKDIQCESQHPSRQLKDILHKRKIDKSLTKHDQDIENLKLILDG